MSYTWTESVPLEIRSKTGILKKELKKRKEKKRLFSQAGLDVWSRALKKVLLVVAW